MVVRRRLVLEGCPRGSVVVPTRHRSARAIATFLWDFVRRPSALDGVDVGDIVPALYELQHGVIEPVLGRVHKSSAAMSGAYRERANESEQR